MRWRLPDVKLLGGVPLELAVDEEHQGPGAVVRVERAAKRAGVRLERLEDTGLVSGPGPDGQHRQEAAA